MLNDVFQVDEIVITGFKVILILILDLILVRSWNFPCHCNHIFVPSLPIFKVFTYISILSSYMSHIPFSATGWVQINLIDVISNCHSLE